MGRESRDEYRECLLRWQGLWSAAEIIGRTRIAPVDAIVSHVRSANIHEEFVP